MKTPKQKTPIERVSTKKPYYNIVIDDRAGFEPETDWTAIIQELKAIGEWDRAT